MTTNSSAFKEIHRFPEGEEILNLTEYNNTILVATNRAVYRVAGGKVEEFKIDHDHPPEREA